MQMPLKVAPSQSSLKEFESYSRFDNGQEKRLPSSLDQDCASRGGRAIHSNARSAKS